MSSKLTICILTRSRSIGRLNARISASINRELAMGGVDLANVSSAQKALLINLEECGNRAGALAERLHISKQAVSKLVHELERQGLIKRQSDPSDGRAQIIVFTGKGKRILTRTLSCFERLEVRIADELGQRQLDTLRGQLAKLAAVLDPEGF